MDKTQGQLDYEADVLKCPAYHDGMPRKTWAQLGEVEQWSWNRPSSIELLERHQNTEAAAIVLKHAADHIYRQRDNGNPGNYRAVDLMDSIRDTMTAS